MGLVTYLRGLTFLAVALGSIALAARQLRRWLLSDWSAPHTYLADSIVSITLVLGISELLGSIGLFQSWTVLLGCVLAGGLVLCFVRSRLPRSYASTITKPSLSDGDPRDRATVMIAVVVATVVAGLWLLHTR